MAPRKRERQIEHLLDSAPDAILCVDHSGTIVVANDAASHVFGYARDELLGSAIEMLVPVAHRARHETLRAEWTAAPKRRDMGASRRLLLFARRKDGSEFPAEISLSPARDVGGVHVTCIVRDATERKQLEARALINERLANAALMSAGLGHEIRGPLTTLLGNLELATRARADPTTPIARDAIDDAREAAHRIAQIVDNLDLIARTEELPARDVELEQVIRSAVRLSATDRFTDARVAIHVAPLPPLSTHSGLLGQVLINLLANAARAVSRLPAHRARIDVTATTDGREVVIEIADNGPGIPRRTLSHIFEPFFTTHADSGGSGVGLAICRVLAQRLGGRIAVDSSPGRGARFRVYLPATESARVRAAAPPTAPAPARPERRAQIVVIDDDRSITEMLQALLRHHDVTVAHDADAAIALLAERAHIDLILCDLHLCGGSGATVYRAVTGERPELSERFVFMTGGAYSRALREFLASVPHRLLHKPFRGADVEALLT